MANKKDAASLIAALGAKIGITPLVLDAEGSLALQVGADLLLHLQHDPRHNHLTLFMSLGTPTAATRQAIYADMLRANRFWRETLGATLSLDDQEPPGVVLALRLACAGLPAGDFLQAVEDVLEVAGDWLPRLSGGGEPGQHETPAPSFDFMAHRV